MNTKELSSIIKDLRAQKGMSQEQLADKSKISLRTVQRVESGDVIPRGDTLKRISDALELQLTELTSRPEPKDPAFLALLNLSALSFLIFPLLGILIPFIIFITKKNKVKGLHQVSNSLINFQITINIPLMAIFVLLTLAIFTFGSVTTISTEDNTTNTLTIRKTTTHFMGMTSTSGSTTNAKTPKYLGPAAEVKSKDTGISALPFISGIVLLIYIFNSTLIIINSFRSFKGEDVIYKPAIKFLK